jgi:hypothetical protein
MQPDEDFEQKVTKITKGERRKRWTVSPPKAGQLFSVFMLFAAFLNWNAALRC